MVKFVSLSTRSIVTDSVDTENSSSFSIQHPQELEDFRISDEDIMSAIQSISTDSACGPDGIPATLLKNCAKELCSPRYELFGRNHLKTVQCHRSTKTPTLHHYLKRATGQRQSTTDQLLSLRTSSKCMNVSSVVLWLTSLRKINYSATTSTGSAQEEAASPSC